MMYYEFNVNDNVYKLRLSTRNVIALEDKLGCNPLMIFGDGSKIPAVKTMVDILHASIQKYHHGITVKDTEDIFDEWLEDGNTIDQFLYVILEVFKVSGIIKQDAEVETEKN